MTEPATCKLCDVDHRRGSDECPARRVGKVVAGKYEIQSLLGAGGMGAVYKARHKTLGTGVAIKMVHAKFAANPDIAQRFEREAQHAAALRHPGIVVVSDLGRADDGTPYLEMELLAGRSVDDIVRSGEMTPGRAVALAIQALDALAYAHNKGIVHRDIKPENLFVTTTDKGEEQVKVVDFGIAKALDTGMGMTQTGSVMGTPLYMSPEQLTDSKSVTAASDVYSMGAALFEMLTGVPPIRATTLPEVMSKVLSGDINRQPSILRGDLPAWVDDVVRRSLARDPSERFTSAKEMKEALIAARSEAPHTPSKRVDAGAVAATLAPNAPTVPPAVPVNPAAATVATVPPPAAKEAAKSTAPPQPVAPVSIVETPRKNRLLVPAIGGVVVVGGIAAFALTRSSSTTTPVADARVAPADAPAVDAATIDATPPAPPEGMVLIPGATIEMGSTADEVDAAFKLCKDSGGGADCRRDIYEREQPKHAVKIAPFHLDRREVTIGDLATWLGEHRDALTVKGMSVTDSTGRLLLDLTNGQSGLEYKNGKFAVLAGRDNRPAVQITWHGALRYCTEHGKRLPLEAEWELAARGTQRRLFPWGDAKPNCDIAYGRDKGMACASAGAHAADVGTSAVDRTPEGVTDLGGNVAEWVEDLFKPHYECTKDCVAKPGAIDNTGGERVVRGGYWDGMAEALRGAGRSRFKSDTVYENVGFRCARSVGDK